jgi:putative spermidine/putrescine transport system substrate-binding protein
MAEVFYKRKLATYALVPLAVWLFACNGKKNSDNSARETKDQQPVRLVSWGGQFQEDLLNFWIKPAAKSCHVPLEAEAWNGEYAALSSRIKKGINAWDIVHVEAHYVQNPDAGDLFESFPERKLMGVSKALQNDRAVPILEYGYVLTYRTDKIKVNKPLTWIDFWDTNRYPGKRGLRDFPLGNIEIALASMGRDSKEVLYKEGIRKIDLERQVTDALNRLGQLKGQIIWWSTGDQLQRGLTTGDTPLAAAWSGRAWSSHKDLCGSGALKDCRLQANESTSLVSTDWWVIPRGAEHAGPANTLLTCLFNDRGVVRGAQKFVLAQGYAVPNESLDVDDPTARFYLELGSSSNPRIMGRIQEKFWGKNYDWISERWRNWRAR